MKVLAKTDSKKYLCEIEQYLDLYFYKLKELKVGDGYIHCYNECHVACSRQRLGGAK